MHKILRIGAGALRRLPPFSVQKKVTGKKNVWYEKGGLYSEKKPE